MFAAPGPRWKPPRQPARSEAPPPPPPPPLSRPDKPIGPRPSHQQQHTNCRALIRGRRTSFRLIKRPANGKNRKNSRPPPQRSPRQKSRRSRPGGFTSSKFWSNLILAAPRLRGSACESIGPTIKKPASAFPSRFFFFGRVGNQPEADGKARRRRGRLSLRGG